MSSRGPMDVLEVTPSSASCAPRDCSQRGWSHQVSCPLPCVLNNVAMATGHTVLHGWVLDAEVCRMLQPRWQEAVPTHCCVWVCVVSPHQAPHVRPGTTAGAAGPVGHRARLLCVLQWRGDGHWAYGALWSDLGYRTSGSSGLLWANGTMMCQASMVSAPSCTCTSAISSRCPLWMGFGILSVSWRNARAFLRFFFSVAARGGTTVAKLADLTVAWAATQTGQVPQRVRSDRGAEIRGLRLE